jgi:hypothetical protein
MKSKLIASVILAVVVTVPATAFSGSLTGGGGGITAPAYGPSPSPNLWDSKSTVFSWDVTFDDVKDLWFYQYDLVVPEKGISHVIIEVSDQFTDDDIIDSDPSDLDDVDWYSATSDGGSNPYLPSLFHGLKVEGAGDELHWQWSFYSAKDPVWGDFYAKDGVNNKPGEKTEIVMWNTGFGNPDSDPTDAPSDGSVGYHILRPDSNENRPPTPELSTWLLLSLSGLAGVFVTRRRKS